MRRTSSLLCLPSAGAGAGAKARAEPSSSMLLPSSPSSRPMSPPAPSAAHVSAMLDAIDMGKFGDGRGFVHPSFFGDDEERKKKTTSVGRPSLSLSPSPTSHEQWLDLDVGGSIIAADRKRRSDLAVLKTPPVLAEAVRPLPVMTSGAGGMKKSVSTPSLNLLSGMMRTASMTDMIDAARTAAAAASVAPSEASSTLHPELLRKRPVDVVPTQEVPACSVPHAVRSKLPEAAEPAKEKVETNPISPIAAIAAAAPSSIDSERRASAAALQPTAGRSRRTDWPSGPAQHAATPRSAAVYPSTAAPLVQERAASAGGVSACRIRSHPRSPPPTERRHPRGVRSSKSKSNSTKMTKKQHCWRRSARQRGIAESLGVAPAVAADLAECFPLTDLPADALFLSFSYLSPSDARAMSASSATMRGAMMGSHEGRRLWTELATSATTRGATVPSAQGSDDANAEADADADADAGEETGRAAWPVLSRLLAASYSGGGKKYELIDDLGVASASTTNSITRLVSFDMHPHPGPGNGWEEEGQMPTPLSSSSSSSINLSVLLSLSTRTTHPSRVDPSVLEKRQMRVRRGQQSADQRRHQPRNGGGGDAGPRPQGGPEYVLRSEFREFEAPAPAPSPPPPSSSSPSIKGDDYAPAPLRSVSVVQFTGQVGQGDRCVRSDAPLPRPSVRRVVESSSHGRRGNSGGRRTLFRSFRLSLLRGKVEAAAGGRSAASTAETSSSSSSSPRSGRSLPLLDRLRRGNGKGQTRLIPFVSPYVREERSRSEDEDGWLGGGTMGIPTAVVDLTPRLVAYFEVSILHRPESSPNADGAVDPSQTWSTWSSSPSSSSSPRAASAPSDCVAVGLSTASFRHRSLMPGWDLRSYGYHSDDGGMFHGSGEMVRRYGPPYGPGDTVGCGVDYGSGDGIFFTLNGEFLGYAWTGLGWGTTGANADAHTNAVSNAHPTKGSPPRLYPTVGVDTVCPVGCNFGERPFMFDLAVFAAKDWAAVESSLECLR